jgi:hypothetical protein
MLESGFERFWSTWPSSPRKGAKAACLKKWEKGYYDTCIDQIIKHVTWMKTTEQWLKGNGAFIPAPLVYLNQQRWDGAEIPEVVQQVSYLDKLDEERKKAVPMPEHIKARLDALRGRN